MSSQGLVVEHLFLSIYKFGSQSGFGFWFGLILYIPVNSQLLQSDTYLQPDKLPTALCSPVFSNW